MSRCALSANVPPRSNLRHEGRHALCPQSATRVKLLVDPPRATTINGLCITMFEQSFKNIDDVLWKEAGCASELALGDELSALSA